MVELAKRTNKRIKVFGSGHSPSDLACTTDFLVNIDDMNSLLSINKDLCTVSVQAGMSLHKLHVVLKENNLALSNLGSISDQSVAGVMATASHGTGAHFGCMSTFVSIFLCCYCSFIIIIINGPIDCFFLNMYILSFSQ